MTKALITLIASLLLAAPVFAGTAEEAFQKLISLQGTWEGTYMDSPIQLSYGPVSDGGAVLERMVWTAQNVSMATMYHVYGDKLMATHYCMGKNQPRLVAEVPTGTLEKLEFHFMDGTNLGKS